ncbi:MAG TPA: TIGR02444 family protein [Gammaproteobacteria bacterium]|nr:TIGR02444 family protein [Gammaproteobacteria bacterium]
MKFPESPFWNYSTEIWTLTGVESACLELQDEFGININMLLYSCWTGSQLLCLNDDDLQILLDAINPLQTIITPLRDSRKMMKQSLIAMPSSMIEQTLANIREMELNAEHMAQLALEKALDLKQLKKCADPSSIACCQSNLNAYLQTLDNISSIDTTAQKINQLLNAIYPDEVLAISNES